MSATGHKRVSRAGQDSSSNHFQKEAINRILNTYLYYKTYYKKMNTFRRRICGRMSD